MSELQVAQQSVISLKEKVKLGKENDLKNQQIIQVCLTCALCHKNIEKKLSEIIVEELLVVDIFVSVVVHVLPEYQRK